MKWLLVYDNSPGPSDIVPYLPTRRDQHHIIVTSRQSGVWRGIAKPLTVATLQRDDSVDFIENRTGQRDREAADKLAGLLGDLPLALEQAGASIESMGLSIKQYVELFELRSDELLNRRSETADYPDSVATTWTIAFQMIGQIQRYGVRHQDCCRMHWKLQPIRSIMGSHLKPLADCLTLLVYILAMFEHSTCKPNIC